MLAYDSRMMSHLRTHGSCGRRTCGLRPFALFVALALLAGPWAKARANDDGLTRAITVEHLITKVAFAADGSGQREVTAVIRVGSEAGVKSLAVLAFPYVQGDQVVDIDYVRVTKPDGTVVVTPAANILNMPADVTRLAPVYSDLHEKHVTVKALSVGDVLESRVLYRTLKPEIPGHFWLDYTFVTDAVCKDEELEVSLPRSTYAKISSRELQPQLSEDGHHRVYTWKSTNLSPTPSAQQRYSLATRPPSVQITSFRSWEEVGHWYGALQERQMVVTPAIRAKASALTMGMTTDDEKIRALYRFVSSRIHYVSLSFGVGRYQPHSADEVLGNEYGDCKDKHTLLAALLRAAGYVAWPALISSSGTIDADVPSPGQFDHVVTVLPRGEDVWWLDTTAEVAPFGFLMPVLRDKAALVIPETGPATLRCTPPNPPFSMDSTITTTSRLDEKGTLTAHMEVSERSDAEVFLRSAFRSVSPPEWQQLVQQISYTTGFAGAVSDVDASTPEDTTKPFHFSFDYRRTEYSDWAHHQVGFPLPAIGLPHFPPDAEKPPDSIWLGMPGEIVQRATLELPHGYLTDVPQPVDVTSDFAEYHATYAQAGDVLFVERHFTLKQRQVQLSEFDQYQRFEKRVTDDEWRLLTLASAAGAGQARAAQSPEAVSWYDKASAAMQKQDLTAAQDALRHVLAVDPSYPRAHAMAATIDLMRGETEHGLAELRKEMELHPDEALVGRMLAKTLMFFRRPGEAIDVWRQVLRSDPQDREAASSLGELLVDAHRYAEAVAALEPAVRLSPDSPDLQDWLGCAYMGMEQADKAWAALKAAAELDPSSDRLNRLAYRMADQNMLLGQARQWAEKAVAEIEAKSETVSLSHLDQDDLDVPVTLAKYWDTMGWLCFREGKLPMAEKYLGAAWALSQRAVEGDHLGQLYERMGRKKEAAHLYELAYASGKSDTPAGLMKRYQRLTGKSLTASPPPYTRLEWRRGEVPSSADDELGKLRTFAVPEISGRGVSADFWLLLVSGGRIEGVKFISGSEQLRNVGKSLERLPLHPEFPDGAPAKMLRRGIVYCGAGDCSLVLLPPDQVRSLQ